MSTLNPATMSDAKKSEYIRTTVMARGDEIRSKHTWLAHQNSIGATIMVVSLLGMIASGWLYISGNIAWWLCVPITAIFASFLHELEHDLIHQMYFRKTPWANNLMLLTVWVARASTINPFVRRKLHLHHHKFSGTKSDLEERGITNGEKWGLRRLLMTGDNMLAVYLRPITMARATGAYINSQNPANEREKTRLRFEQLTSYMPLGALYYIAFHGWVVIHATLFVMAATHHSVALPSMFTQGLHLLDVFAVIYMLPSVLRTFCLHFISSNMHYYGDVESRNAMQQCQVLNVWWLAPMQVFCFNFGSTHAIHHFVVKEPFYIRQWTAPVAHKVMREMGVRFNDLGTFRRANRFAMEEKVVG
ncbi:MAG: fatty acid desaturase [Aquirhabdus sp.]